MQFSNNKNGLEIVIYGLGVHVGKWNNEHYGISCYMETKNGLIGFALVNWSICFYE
jgi:hypothetical protein